MKSLAKAYKKLKRQPSFKMTKDEFLLYVMMLFPMMKIRILRLPLKPELKIVEYSTDYQPKPVECVEIDFNDLMNYLSKRFLKLQAKT